MMGRRDRDQGQLFYEFSLDEMIPADHLCRREWDFCPRRQAPQNLPKRRDLRAETQEAALTIAKNRPKIGLSAGRPSTASFGGLLRPAD